MTGTDLVWGGKAPAAAPTASLDTQLNHIAAMARDLSSQHRRALPKAMVANRMPELARVCAPLFADRALEICFLLDQHGKLRYNELRRMLGVISTRTLASKLVFLHRQGLVDRVVHGDAPARIDYSLTPRGQRLTDLLFPAMLHAMAGPEAP